MFYRTIQRYIKKLIIKIKKQVKLIKKLLIIVLTYNNFDYTKNRKDKRVNKIRQFKFITITLIFKSYKFDLISLRKKI